ncbi:hypothetical protein BJX76DRAFT_360924 [Aspergillus varians]
MGSTTKDKSHVGVLIVAAGPAGLMMEMIDQGLSKWVFDGQADGLQYRTLEIFDSFGFGDRACKKSKSYAQRGVLPTKLEPDESPVESSDAYPKTVHLQHLPEAEATQQQTGTAVNGSNIQHDLFWSKPSADDTEEPIRASVLDAKANTEEIVKTKYMLGADGAHSWGTWAAWVYPRSLVQRDHCERDRIELRRQCAKVYARNQPWQEDSLREDPGPDRYATLASPGATTQQWTLACYGVRWQRDQAINKIERLRASIGSKGSFLQRYKPAWACYDSVIKVLTTTQRGGNLQFSRDVLSIR